MSTTFEFPATVEEFMALTEPVDPLGPVCEWSDLRERTCAHCIYGPAAYTDFPSAEELWS